MIDLNAMVITFNEAPNIGRCLENLRWVPRVLVVDSFSTDETLKIAQTFPNVEIVQRTFDTFAGQCRYGLGQLQSKWVLSLDCDYLPGPGFAAETRELVQSGQHAGWKAGFRYCVQGHALRGTLYPPRCILYLREAAIYEDEGHGHRVRIQGTIGAMRSLIDHDDRKPLSRWLASQAAYARREADHLLQAGPGELSWIDRLRSTGWIMPLLAPAYCLIIKGLWRDGLAGWHYTLQRTLAELAIALALADARLSRHPRLSERSPP